MPQICATESFRVVLFVFEFDGFAESPFKVAHQVHASLGSFLFLFKMFLETYFFDSAVTLFDERINVPVILSVLAR